MQDRINQIKQYLADYGKESHAEALESAYKFESIIKNMPHSININCYQADALTDSIKLDKLKPDALKTDALEPDALMPDALKPDTLKLNTLKPDALNLVTLKQDQSEMNDKIDIVITDIPYGKLVEWITEDGKDAVSVMLQNLLPKLSKQSIVAVSSRKRTAIYNDNYTRVSKFQIGKRQIVLLRPNS